MVPLDIIIDSKLEVVNIYNILHTSELKYNFFSVSIIEKAEYSILAKNRKIIFYDNKDNVAFEATRIGTSYLVNVSTSKKTLALAFLYSVPHTSTSWTYQHRRLGHLNMQDIKKLVQISTGLDFEKITSLEKFELSYKLCESCMIGKQY